MNAEEEKFINFRNLKPYKGKVEQWDNKTIITETCKYCKIEHKLFITQEKVKKSVGN